MDSSIFKQFQALSSREGSGGGNTAEYDKKIKKIKEKELAKLVKQGNPLENKELESKLKTRIPLEKSRYTKIDLTKIIPPTPADTGELSDEYWAYAEEYGHEKSVRARPFRTTAARVIPYLCEKTEVKKFKLIPEDAGRLITYSKISYPISRIEKKLTEKNLSQNIIEEKNGTIITPFIMPEKLETPLPIQQHKNSAENKSLSREDLELQKTLYSMVKSRDQRLIDSSLRNVNIYRFRADLKNFRKDPVQTLKEIYTDELNHDRGALGSTTDKERISDIKREIRQNEVNLQYVNQAIEKDIPFDFKEYFPKISEQELRRGIRKDNIITIRGKGKPLVYKILKVENDKVYFNDLYRKGGGSMPIEKVKELMDDLDLDISVLDVRIKKDLLRSNVKEPELESKRVVPEASAVLVAQPSEHNDNDEKNKLDVIKKDEPVDTIMKSLPVYTASPDARKPEPERKEIEPEQTPGDYAEVLRLIRETMKKNGEKLTPEEFELLKKYKNLKQKISDIEFKRELAREKVNSASLSDWGNKGPLYRATIPQPDQVTHKDLEYKTKKEMSDAVEDLYNGALQNLGLPSENTSVENTFTLDTTTELNSDQNDEVMDLVIAQLQKELQEAEAAVRKANETTSANTYNDGDPIYAKNGSITNSIKFVPNPGNPLNVQVIDYKSGIIIAEKPYSEFKKVDDEHVASFLLGEGTK